MQTGGSGGQDPRALQKGCVLNVDCNEKESG